MGTPDKDLTFSVVESSITPAPTTKQMVTIIDDDITGSFGGSFNFDIGQALFEGGPLVYQTAGISEEGFGMRFGASQTIEMFSIDGGLHLHGKRGIYLESDNFVELSSTTGESFTTTGVNGMTFTTTEAGTDIILRNAEDLLISGTDVSFNSFGSDATSGYMTLTAGGFSSNLNYPSGSSPFSIAFIAGTDISANILDARFKMNRMGTGSITGEDVTGSVSITSELNTILQAEGNINFIELSHDPYY